MKTRHFFGAMALALASLTLASCSGGGSSDSGLFGALPGEMTRYESEMKALEEKAKDIKTEADKKKLIAESQEIQEKYTTKIEETAKALDGTELKVTDGEFAVAQPVTLTFDGFASKKELTPRFKLGGALRSRRFLARGSPDRRHLYRISRRLRCRGDRHLRQQGRLR